MNSVEFSSSTRWQDFEHSREATGELTGAEALNLVRRLKLACKGDTPALLHDGWEAFLRLAAFRRQEHNLLRRHASGLSIALSAFLDSVLFRAFDPKSQTQRQAVLLLVALERPDAAEKLARKSWIEWSSADRRLGEKVLCAFFKRSNLRILSYCQVHPDVVISPARMVLEMDIDFRNELRVDDADLCVTTPAPDWVNAEAPLDIDVYLDGLQSTGCSVNVERVRPVRKLAAYKVTVEVTNPEVEADSPRLWFAPHLAGRSLAMREVRLSKFGVSRLPVAA